MPVYVKVLTRRCSLSPEEAGRLVTFTYAEGAREGLEPPDYTALILADEKEVERARERGGIASRHGVYRPDVIDTIIVRGDLPANVVAFEIMVLAHLLLQYRNLSTANPEAAEAWVRERFMRGLAYMVSG